jgi:hypothetical protein
LHHQQGCHSLHLPLVFCRTKTSNPLAHHCSFAAAYREDLQSQIAATLAPHGACKHTGIITQSSPAQDVHAQPKLLELIFSSYSKEQGPDLKTTAL